MAMDEAKRRDFIMSREHMDIRELAKTLKVCEEVVRRWIRDGNLFAVKDGMKWWIPRTDARLFIDEYRKKGRVRGRVLEVSVPLSPRAGMRIQGRTRATTDQTVNIWLSVGYIHAIDAERRLRGGKVTRSAIINEALKSHLRLD